MSYLYRFVLEHVLSHDGAQDKECPQTLGSGNEILILFCVHLSYPLYQYAPADVEKHHEAEHHLEVLVDAEDCRCQKHLLSRFLVPESLDVPSNLNLKQRHTVIVHGASRIIYPIAL